MARPSDDVIGALGALGFSPNEARAYRDLLVESPATGYEIAQRASIPRSAIYAVLKRLEEEGLVARVEESPARFAPLPPSDLLDVLRHRFDGSVKQLHDSLVKLRPPPPPVDLWNVTGYEAVLDRAAALVAAAQKQLFLSIWRREAERLRVPLDAAARRGVNIVVFSFCALSAIPGRIFSYGLDERDLEAFWQHKLILIADHTRTLMGETELDERSDAVVTGHPAVSEVALNNIALDITLFAQRRQIDASRSLVEMLGERLGSLDALVAKHPAVGQQ